VANVYYAQPLLEHIGESVAIPTGRLGWIVASGQAGYLVGLAALVPLGDWVNRRLLIPVHLLLATLGTTVVATSTGPTALYLGAALAGTFSVVVQIAVAYAAALSDPGERGHNIGIVTSGVVIGIIMARTAAGAVASLGGWRAIYVLAACLGIVMALLSWILLPNDRPRQARSSYRLAVGSVFVLTATDRVFRTRALIAFFLFASFGVLWSGLALPLSGDPWRLSPARIGLFGFAGLAGTLGAARAGRWSDQGRTGAVTVTALIVLIISWWFIAQAQHTLWCVVIGAVVLDFAVQAVHVTNQNLIVVRSPDSSSRVIGAYMIYYSLGSALGAITTSTLYEHRGWPAACLLGAGYAAAALAIFGLDRTAPGWPSHRAGTPHFWYAGHRRNRPRNQ
jgi:predicted MFS family arabinose efflux permease